MVGSPLCESQIVTKTVAIKRIHPITAEEANIVKKIEATNIPSPWKITDAAATLASLLQLSNNIWAVKKRYPPFSTNSAKQQVTTLN